MSYLVLARKYRPRNFSEMVGQGHVVQALSNALSSARLHHAYLFTGTRGVGKTTVARILAKSLNCQGVDGCGGITATPCGVCSACSDIDSGRFIDYTELDAASNRGVDEVQALLEQAAYKPVQGRFKVFMIDEVHMLSSHAFNAMLKTLEEPPEYLKFVLATTDPQKVPVTVLSRCLQFNLRPMAPETIRQHLQKVLQAESVRADAPALRLLARAARGSMRDALSLADQAIAFGSGVLEEDLVRQMLGSVDHSYVFRLLDALAAGNAKVVIEIVDTLRLHGLSAASTLEEMCALLQGMAVLQAGATLAADDDGAELAELSGLAQRMAADETQLLYSMCLHGRSELGLAPDEYAALTMVLLRLLAFKSGTGVVAPVEKKSLKSGQLDALRPLQPAPVPGKALPVVDAASFLTQPRSRPAAPAPVPGITQTDVQTPVLAAMSVHVMADSPRAAPLRDATQLAQASVEGDFWYATVQSLIGSEAIAALVRELALQSQLVARDADQWLLRVERESLNQSLSRERLSLALTALGYPVKVVVEIGRVTDSPALRQAAADAQRLLEAEKIVFADPLVRTLMSEFAAKIVPGSVQPL